MKNKKENDLQQYVVKSNELIRHSRYNLTAQQQHIVLYAISKIRPEDSVYQEYEINIKDICDACGLDYKQGSYYQSIKQDFEKLLERRWGVLPDGCTVSLSWIGDVRITEKSGTITYTFNPNMRPFLFELHERYTQYRLENVLALRRAGSIRLYELLRSYTTQGKLDNGITQEIELELDDLRKRLDYDGAQYPRWVDFSRYVLEKAIMEINSKIDDMRVEFTPIRNGRSITKVLFTISSPSSSEAWNAYKNRREQLKL